MACGPGQYTEEEGTIVRGVSEEKAGTSVQETSSGSVQHHEMCSWVISPPPHRMLKLTVDTQQIRNGEWRPRRNGKSILSERIIVKIEAQK